MGSIRLQKNPIVANYIGLVHICQNVLANMQKRSYETIIWYYFSHLINTKDKTKTLINTSNTMNICNL
jgi:hypothetical protein